MLRKSIGVAVVLVAFWCRIGPATAQENKALQIVPEDAAGFVIINNIGEADGKVTKLAQTMQLPLPASPLQLAQISLGIQEGLNTRGSAVVMAFFDDRGPGVVVGVPVSDYAKFIKQLGADDAKAKVTTGQGPQGEQLILGQLPGYALVAPAMFRGHVEHVVKSKKNVVASVTKLQGWINDNDVSAVATPSGIKAGITLMLKELEKAEKQIGNLPPQAQAVASLLGPARNLAKLAGKEVTHLAVGAKIDAKQNVHLRARSLFVKGGKISGFAGQVKAPEGGPLAGLPNGNLIFAFGGSFSSEMFTKLTELSTKLMTASGQVNEETAKKISGAYANMFKGIKGMSVAMHVNEAGRPLFGENIISVVRTTDAAAYVKRYHETLKEFNELAKGIQAPGFGGGWKAKMVKVEGKPGLEVTVDMGGQLPPGVDGLFGENGKMVATIFALDKTRIISMYVPADKAANTLAKLKKRGSLADNEQIKATAQLLPKGSQWVGYVSLRGLSEIVGGLAANFAGIQIPAFPESPPIGFGERISDTDLDARVVIPIGVLQNVMRYVGQLQQLGQ